MHLKYILNNMNQINQDKKSIRCQMKRKKEKEKHHKFMSYDLILL